MRIRKLASRILGTASFAVPSYSPPRAAAAAAGAGRIGTQWADELCELNRSPWDVDAITAPPPTLGRCHLRSIPQELEIEADGGGSLVNAIIQQKPISSDPEKRNEEEQTSDDDYTNAGKKKMKIEKKKQKTKPQKKKNPRAKKEKGLEAPAEAAATGDMRCKKSDGKAWKCKRRAQYPHTLCTYHLNQLRSYNQSYKLTPKVPAVRTQVKKRQRSVANTAANGNRSSLFLYYGGFGPWRRKKRGSNDSATAKWREEEEEGREEEEGSKKNLGLGDGEDATAVMDVDGEDDREDGEDGDGEEKAMSDGGELMGKKKKDNNPGKRARKRVKARSLKSLL